MIPPRQLFVLLLLVGAVSLSGCRTYGGWGAGPETYEAMQVTVQSFADQLTRAQQDLERLEQAASEADTLQSLADHFRHLVAQHDSLLAAQRARVGELSAGSSYRTLHSAYGAMVTEQRRKERQYQHAIRDVRAAILGSSVVRTSEREAPRYMVTPIGFPKEPSQEPLTMEQALQGL